MISVSEARQLIQANTSLLEPISTPLYEANGRVMAEDLESTTDVPPFDQSAMDGYAFNYADFNANTSLAIMGEIAAGVFPQHKLLPQTAFRIYTGAQVPKGCDTIVMQEKVRVKEGHIYIEDSQLKVGANIRLKGSQTKKGELVLKAGTRISPGIAGFMAGLGVSQVMTFRVPRVGIINTGKELSSPGLALLPGKIYESNSYSLNAALRELHIKPAFMVCVDDDEAQTTKLIQEHLSHCDVMLLSGGVSVGDHDYVEQSLKNCGVEKIFHKVKQKPGKPLYFGRKGKRLFFGLPGNPAAVLTCYYEYVMPSLLQLMGIPVNTRSKILLPLRKAYSKKPGLTHFLKGKIHGHEVEVLPAQESYLMNSFAAADCIIQLEEEKNEFERGSLVEVHPLFQPLLIQK
ncbi:MAG: molybdopterin molybdotransferase MoeA [bacterium]|nr:molybdopterin molybdotransferase MoeA [bacterium]